jgi:hypothetical protein
MLQIKVNDPESMWMVIVVPYMNNIQGGVA